MSASTKQLQTAEAVLGFCGLVWSEMWWEAQLHGHAVLHMQTVASGNGNL